MSETFLKNWYAMRGNNTRASSPSNLNKEANTTKDPKMTIGLYSEAELADFKIPMSCDHENGGLANAPEGGNHFDVGKTRYDLVPIDALEEEAKVWAYGAGKYGDGNWEKGIKWSRLFASTLRHLFQWWRGEDTDKESGLLHLAHVRCCVGMLIGLRNKRSLDNRPSSLAF